MDRKRITWEQTSKNHHLSSEDVVVTKTTAYLPFLGEKYTKKEVARIYRESGSAIQKMKNL